MLLLPSLIQKRRSCRAYRPDPVPQDLIEILLEAARQAPSACNRQPWRFAVVTRPETRAAIASRGLLPGLSLHWVATAPVLIVMGLRHHFLTHRLAPLISGVAYANIDLGIAGQHLVLQAAELELGTCWIGWIRPRVIRKLVGWPRSIRPSILFTVGWPQESADAQPRPRLPLADLARWI